MNYAYVTIMTNDRFYPGLCALKDSLDAVHSRYPLVVLIPETMDEKEKKLIRDLGVTVMETENLRLDKELEDYNPVKRWNMTFFKLKVFELVQFDKIVFLDADIVVLKNIDDLFEKPHMSCVPAGLCAHKDWTRLNSGVMVLVPNHEDYRRLIAAIPAAGEERRKLGVPFGDQDVINYCNPDWFDQKELVLGEEYNTMSSCIRKFVKYYGYKNMRVLHFAENVKPWQYKRGDLAKVLLASLSRLNFMRIRVVLLYVRCLKRSCPNYLDFG